MNRELTVMLTPRLILWTLFYQLRPLLVIFSLVFLGMIYNLFFLIAHMGTFPLEAWLNFLPYLLIPAFFAFLFYSAYSKNMKLIRKMKTPAVKYRITDEWLHVDSDLTSAKTAWAAYKGLRKNAKIWQIVGQGGTVHSLPVELLDEDLKAFLTAKLPKASRGWTRNFFLILAAWLLVFVVFMYFLRPGHH